MHKHSYAKWLIAAALAAISGISAADTASQNLVEARQESQIWTTYALNPNLRASDLKVSVHAGTATLTGTVDEAIEKDLAKQIALGVSGIQNVDNQIVVDPAYVMAETASADRSFGETVNDATITASIKSKLLWSKHAQGLKTDVDTKRGRVTLLGSAHTAEQRAFAGRLAANTEDVVSVDNQLVVDNKPKLAAAAGMKMDDAEQVVSDAWITAKVKSTLLYSRSVEGSQIKVETKNGLVTLSGSTDTREERKRAIALAQTVRGVKLVIATNLHVV